MDNTLQTNTSSESLNQNKIDENSQVGSRLNEVSAIESIAQDTAISSLAPKILTDPKDLARIKPYLDALKNTIDTKGITNIALTGNYGSGKSTIINTFLSRNDKYSYLRISLASFGDVTKEVEESIKDNDGKTHDESESIPNTKSATTSSDKKNFKIKNLSKEKKDELERLLEISILQQVFYHVKPSDIPDSRFKRITNLTDEKIYGIAAVLIFWIISLVILFKFDYINRINPSTWKLALPIDWIAFPIFFIFFLGIGLFAKSIVRLLSNSKINKVNIKGELELGDKLDKSVFNEHLEEILYFFERTTYNLVIIEDLDRFDSTDIFTKLRELNILLNNSLSIKERKSHKEIVFLYAIRDEIFKDKNERVKFFEYIIPVIPFINPSNAGEQLSKLISGANLESVLSSDFTEDVVTFIDDIDMRLLTNIFHEYQLYKQNLSEVLDQDKLFAMITYKNMFPDDFGLLHSRKGNLYSFLSRRDTYLKSLAANLDAQILSIHKEIENIESVTLNNIRELKSVYINAIHEKIPKASAIELEGRKTFTELMDDKNFSSFSKLKKIQYYYYTVQSDYTSYTLDRETTGTSTISFSDLEGFVNPEFTYQERVQMLSDANGGKIDILRSEINLLKAKKIELESWSIVEIFEHVDINLYLEKFSDNKLIRMLLLNGYIDENYNDYISLFHEVNLSSEDFVFEKRVKSGINSAFDYKLTHTSHLIKKLNDKYFRREVILNLDLVECLLSNIANIEVKCESLFKLLSDERERTLLFIDEFVTNRPTQLGEFVRSLSASWKGVWEYVEKKSGFPNNKIERYLQLLIVHAGIDDLVNLGPSLGIFISKKINFLSMFKEEHEQYQAKIAIEKLGVKFETLEPPVEATEQLFEFVYLNNFYQINIDNILLMLRKKGTNINEDTLKTSNYTAIQTTGGKELKSYISEFINEYVKNVFLKLPENKSESEEYVVALLNNENLKTEHKESIVKGDYVSVSKISEIESFDIQQAIMNHNRMEPTWENIFTYYDLLESEVDEEAEFDETLIRYFNVDENFNKLSSEGLSVNGGRPEPFIRKFVTRIMQTDKFNQDAYIALMKSHPYNSIGVDFENLHQDKVKWLVENRRLNLNKFNYDELKEHFEPLHMRLVEVMQSDFTSKIKDLDIDEQDAIKLFNALEFTKTNKIVLFKTLEDDTIIQNPDLAQSSCNLLFDVADITLSYEVIESMFKHTGSIENRIRLLNIHFEKLSSPQIQILLESLGGNYKKIFVARHQRKFRNTDFHTELFAKLKQKRLIRNVEPLEKDITMLKVFANY